MKRKVCVVVTARPSYSRIKTALAAMREHPELELQIVVAASALLDRYGNAVRVVEQDGFQISARVFSVLEGENLVTSAKSTGLALTELATVFANLQPHIAVTIADRYETIATSIAAAYMNITLAHVQGGEVTGSIDEKVRHANTKLADIHLVSSQAARERVLRMGEEPDSVYVTGCPSIDIAARVMQRPEMDFDPFARYGGVGEAVDLSGGYVVVMQHPVTTEQEEAGAQVLETLHAVTELGLPTLWFWPNVDAGSDSLSKAIRMFREQERPKNIHFFDMHPEDFLRLLINSRCIVGNSSVAIRECAFLGVPAVNIGTRQQGRDRGRNVVDVGYDRAAIAEAVTRHLNGGKRERDLIYGDGRAGERIAEVLATCPLKITKRLTY